jgi:hypothetical protein
MLRGHTDGLRRRTGKPDQTARRTGQGGGANRDAADAFAANVLPVVRQIKASGATTFRAIAEALKTGASAQRGAGLGMTARSGIYWHDRRSRPLRPWNGSGAEGKGARRTLQEPRIERGGPSWRLSSVPHSPRTSRAILETGPPWPLSATAAADADMPWCR